MEKDLGASIFKAQAEISSKEKEIQEIVHKYLWLFFSKRSKISNAYHFFFLKKKEKRFRKTKKWIYWTFPTY